MESKHASLDIKGILILMVLCASWGINQVAIKVAIESIPPVLQCGIRSIGSGLLVLLWMTFKRIPVLTKDKTLGWGILVGLLFSSEFILIYLGLNFTNASRAGIFLNTAPFVVAIGAQIFLPAENLTKLQITGLFLAFGGIMVAFNESINLPTKQMLMGDIMLIGAAILWGATTIVIKCGPLASIAPSKTLLYQLGVSALFLPIASILFNEPDMGTMTFLSMASMAYQIVWVAFITYIAWFWLISNYAVSRLTSFTFLTPLFGVMAGAFFLKEPVTLYLVTALIMVGTGIFLVNRK